MADPNATLNSDTPTRSNVNPLCYKTGRQKRRPDMIFDSTTSLQNAVAKAANVRESLIDDLIYTAVFSGDEAVKAEARKQIHLLARKNGAISTTIFPLYDAIGRGELKPTFTVP